MEKSFYANHWKMGGIYVLRLSRSKQTASDRTKTKQKCWYHFIIVMCLTGLIMNIILLSSTTISARYVLNEQINFTIRILPAGN
jgi:hypothetical protein